MRRRNPVMALTLSTSLALSVAACGDKQANEFLFVALGSIGGAVLGSQIGDGNTRAVSTAVGGILGAYAARQALWWLDEQDKIRSDEALNSALETSADGDRVVWSNPDSGVNGFALADDDTRTSSRSDCRTFETYVTNGTEQETEKGVACRSSDGSWRVQAPS